MAALTKNAISVTVRDRAKRTKTWDHKGYKSQIKNVTKLFLVHTQTSSRLGSMLEQVNTFLQNARLLGNTYNISYCFRYNNFFRKNVKIGHFGQFGKVLKNY